MKLVIVFTLVVLLSLWVEAQTLPECSITACNVTSDCPKTNSFDHVVSCSGGACISTKITFLGIGEECDVTSATARCNNGLACANSICQTTRSYGCKCETREECDGFLCINGTCDAMRSIGDSCTIDDHCGSICSSGVCIAGPIGAKCNAHHSCDSKYCDDDSFTCQNDARQACSASSPFGGKCDDPNALCYDGTCYSRNGNAGDKCNSSLSFPQCKVYLACVDGTCSTIPEGNPCTSANECNRLQSCVCAPTKDGSRSLYGCYTTQGIECTLIYQALEDCLNLCSELGTAEGIPGTCAHKCTAKRSAYECCTSCNNDSPLINYNGTCPDIQPVDCCSTDKACTTTTTCSETSTTPPTTSTDKPATEPPTDTGTDRIGSDASMSVPYLALAALLAVASVYLS